MFTALKDKYYLIWIIVIFVFVFYMYKDMELFECVKDISFDTLICPNDRSTDLYAFNGKLYMVDRRKIYNHTNPRIFVNYSDYLTYSKANKCKIIDERDIKTLPKKDIKKMDLIDDPTEPYLKQCNKKIAAYMAKAGNSYNNHNHDYKDNKNGKSEKLYNSALNYRYDNDVEKCMLEMLLNEHK